MFERDISELEVENVLSQGELIETYDDDKPYSIVTLEKNGATIVFKHVPALICSNCGEEYIDSIITRELFEKAHEIQKSGVAVDIREYSGDAA